ncbi:hypothetical protein DENSPDRAFT_832262 [Dentipellis sp. KUC8613]|nr:hypothetical protein DENSPDRAFT_832262 [Dentipellis sp. KUC8613]
MSSPYQAYGGPTQGSNDPYLYPPPNNKPYELNSSSTVNVVQLTKNEDAARRISRTPSPTPSEQAELDRDTLFDYKKLMNWRFWIRKEWIWYYLALTVILVLTALITIYHTTIVKWLTPAANWMKDLTCGWLIPIAILFVISFPPLFGHEVVAVLCGVVWGLWIGFAIVAAGTFLGELGTYYAFKYCCRTRGEKLEKSNITYACLAKVVREGGFKIVFLARLSAIPGHFTTAIFSTCGIGVITFSIAAILSLPKQFVTVYLGVLIDGTGSSETTGQKIASDAVVAITVIITFVSMWYIYRQMGKVRHQVIYERRKARQVKLQGSDLPYASTTTFGTTGTTSFNPRGSDSDIPLTAPGFNSDPEAQQFEYQQWDANGRAVGYAGDPRLHAPQPQHAASGSVAGLGVQYPTSPRGDGRLPVRQQSDDSMELSQRTPQGVASPPNPLPDPFASADDHLHNPYEAQPPPPMPQPQTQPQSLSHGVPAQYTGGSSPPPPSYTSRPF